jgi:CheY-like chemotaxis protein
MSAVLVVDDDAAFRERIVAFLEELLPGTEIVAVGDGNTAVTRALELRPRHVVLDVAMPGPSGYRVATAVGQALPTTQIVILSGAEGVDEESVPAGTVYVRKDGAMEDSLRAVLA